MVANMTARVWLMYFDHGVSLTEAVNWVTRRMPRGLRDYYRSLIIVAFEQALY